MACRRRLMLAGCWRCSCDHHLFIVGGTGRYARTRTVLDHTNNKISSDLALQQEGWWTGTWSSLRKREEGLDNTNKILSDLVLVLLQQKEGWWWSGSPPRRREKGLDHINNKYNTTNIHHSSLLSHQQQHIGELTRIISHLWAGDLHVLHSLGTKTPTFSWSSQRSISGMKTGRSAIHYYDVLGLSPNATQGQIKSAYYKLSKLHHPDVTESSRSHSLFTEINEAYEILGNLRKRRMYDKGVFNPRDTRGDTVVDDETKDYSQAYRTSSNFERGGRPPPPSGRSKIYNFDEFYRQHYNELRERRSAEYKEYVNYKQMMDHNNSNLNPESYIVFLLGWSLLMIICVAILFEKNYDKDQVKSHQKSESAINEHYLSPNSISARDSKGEGH